MLNSFIPKSWLFRQNRKAIRPRVAIDAIERFESRDLPSASPLLLDVPRWVERADWNPADVARALQNNEGDSGRHERDLQPSGRWDKVVLGDWYVPAANLLAYYVSPNPLELIPIADQTIFHITSAENGVFSGENTVTFSKPTLLGLQTGESTTYSMAGIVTREGKVRIEFSSLETGDPLVTGVGEMQFVDHAWRITMQMATGVTPYVTHWAYMSKLPNGGTPPPAVLPDNESLHNAEFRWLEGTRWALTDTELFAPPTTGCQGQPGVEFQVDGYRNGYFWGTSPSGSATPLTVAGSVTPKGNLFLALTTEDGTTVTRTGVLKRGSGGHWTMHFRAYGSTAAVGVAWKIPS
ncbi:MAG: hypothetical protein JWN70_4400 [Planctomycetaceae bacterium]|nr:hypothetical protein [Planctomycetaceae bacterium]